MQHLVSKVCSRNVPRNCSGCESSDVDVCTGLRGAAGVSRVFLCAFRSVQNCSKPTLEATLKPTLCSLGHSTQFTLYDGSGSANLVVRILTQ